MKQLLVMFGLIALLLFPGVVSAQHSTPSGALLKALQTPVDYELPYPGLLPDSMFYPLKAFRDKLISFFITDAQKQAEFDLLQADKHLAAGEMLLAEKNPPQPLVSETISKGDNYFQDAIVNIAEAKKQGRLVNDFLSKLTNASIKHQQVLYAMTTRSQGQLRQDLLGDIQRVQDFAKQVKKLSQQQ